MKIERMICPDCIGHGAYSHKGADYDPCPKCGGKGEVMKTERECLHCEGTGTFKSNEGMWAGEHWKCPACKGSGKVTEEDV